MDFFFNLSFASILLLGSQSPHSTIEKRHGTSMSTVSNVLKAEMEHPRGLFFSSRFHGFETALTRSAPPHCRSLKIFFRPHRLVSPPHQSANEPHKKKANKENAICYLQRRFFTVVLLYNVSYSNVLARIYPQLRIRERCLLENRR